MDFTVENMKAADCRRFPKSIWKESIQALLLSRVIYCSGRNGTWQGSS